MKKILAAALTTALLLVVGVVVGVSGMFFQMTSTLSGGAGGSSNPACVGGAPAAALSVDSSALPAVTGYTPEQVAIVAVIMQSGEAAGVGERGQLIGIMTAMQESTLTNLPGGDRDSIGVFQQRPSMGWGTPEQLNDVSYAANAFFNGVEDKGIPGLADIDGWETMSLTQAAQTVQNSGHPDAYAKREAGARELMAALAGVPVDAASGSLTQANLGCASGPVAQVAPGDLPTQAQFKQPSASVPCPEGTTDLGAATGAVEGQQVELRLCSVTGTVCTGSDCRAGGFGGLGRGEVIVSSLTAPHFMKWLNEVRAQGYDPTFSSSFRPWESQEAVWRGGTNQNAARPGWSNHQSAAAVDIADMGGSYTRNNCEGKAPDGACMKSGDTWKTYHEIANANGATFHDEEFWHLEWVITRADQRNVPFVLAA